MNDQSIHEETLFHEQQAHDMMKSGYELGVIDAKSSILAECIMALSPNEYKKLKKSIDDNWEKPEYDKRH